MAPSRLASASVEVTIRLLGDGPGESEVEISIPETSDLAARLEGGSPEEAAIVFSRLHRRVSAELADAFRALGEGAAVSAVAAS